jgi:hypothetical protein
MANRGTVLFGFWCCCVGYKRKWHASRYDRFGYIHEFLYECRTEGHIENDSTARIHGIHWVSNDRFMIANENCITVWQLPRDTILGEKYLTCTTYYDTTVR